MKKPTPEQFAAFSSQFDWFNSQLFNGLLSPVLLNFSRKAGAAGFFAPDRWEGAGASRAMHEISVSPETLSRPVRETAQTLVHEMVHLWQREYGTPSRRGYHNREWVSKMREIGLEPVSLDGKDGTGQRVSDKVIEGGRFVAAFERMPEKYQIPYKCRPEGARNGASERNKSKYRCPRCGANIWGKPGLRVSCEDCELSFEEQEAEHSGGARHLTTRAAARRERQP